GPANLITGQPRWRSAMRSLRFWPLVCLWLALASCASSGGTPAPAAPPPSAGGAAPAAPAAGGAPPAAAAPRPITVAYAFISAETLPIWTAQELDLFAQQGLEAK